MADKTILVVDDSAVLRASVRFTLEAAGYGVAEADNGQAGLERLAELEQQGQRPAMIITDVNMPIMDGITFIKRVKTTNARFIPILILTTESQEKKKNEGKEAGATGWLVKPFKEDQLQAVVRKLAR